MDKRQAERMKKLQKRESDRRKKNILASIIILIVLLLAILLVRKLIFAKKDPVDKKLNANNTTSSQKPKTPAKTAGTGEKTKDKSNEKTGQENNKADKSNPEDGQGELDKPIDIYKYEEKPFNKKDEFAHLLKAEQKIKDEKELIKKLPKQMRESIRKYPETKSELLQYLKYKDKLQSPDITGQYKKGDIPRFIQWDSRWGFRKIGNSFISYAACGPTSLASAYIHFTGDTTMNPAAMSKWAVDNGYYSDATGSGHILFIEGPGKLGLTSGIFELNRANLKERLDNGDIVIINVGPGDFTRGGHYVMIIGFNTKTDELTIHDVNSPKNSLKKWDFDRVLPQVKQAFYINK